jgi:hypothetical protein
MVFIIIVVIQGLYLLGMLYCQSWQTTEKTPPIDYSLFKGICQEECHDNDKDFQAFAKGYFCWVHDNAHMVPIDYRQNMHDQLPWIREVIGVEFCEGSSGNFFQMDVPDPMLPTYDKHDQQLNKYIFAELHYCSTKSMYELRKTSFANTVCYRGEYKQHYSNLIVLLSSGVMLIMNIISMKLISYGLSFVPFKLRSSRVCWEVVFGILSLYINNILLLLFIHSPYFQTLFMNDLSNSKQTFQNIPIFFDIDRDWFDVVGSKITKLLLMTILCWSLLELVLLHLSKRIRRRRVFSAQDQSQALSILQPRDYSFSSAISHLVSVILVTLTFFTGIPLMVPACFLAMILFFILEKYKLYYFSKYPIILSKKVMWICYYFLCTGLLIHVVMAIFILGSNELFLKHWNTQIVQLSFDDYQDNHQSPTFFNNLKNHFSNFVDRAKDQKLYLGLLIFFSVFFFIQPFIYKLFGKFMSKKLPMNQEKPMKEESKQPVENKGEETPSIKKPKNSRAIRSQELRSPQVQAFFGSEFTDLEGGINSVQTTVNKHLVNYDYKYKDENICIFYGWDLYKTFLIEMKSRASSQTFNTLDNVSSNRDVA